MNNESNKLVSCDGCGMSTDSFFITKYQDGKNYCSHCDTMRRDKTSTTSNLVKESGFDVMLRDAISTPPLRLKDLKEKLRKEREEKRDSERKKDSE
jgi:trehalose-6-phosphate synthase